MKIGIFDSGLGGLLISKAIRKYLPKYDYIYLGDTKRVPYGNRSHEEVYQFTREGVKYLFDKENCGIVIIACNTSSARALRSLQKEYKNKKVLGVLIPAAEECAGFERIGVLGTEGTIASGTFPKEIKKLNNRAKVFQNPAPMLVPLIEAGDDDSVDKFIIEYLKPLLDKKIDALVLGCTHYPILKNKFKKYTGGPRFNGRLRGMISGHKIKIISQDEIVPKKLKNYLVRHPEIKNKLSKNKKVSILVTKVTQNINKLSRKWFGVKIKPKLIKL